MIASIDVDPRNPGEVLACYACAHHVWVKHRAMTWFGDGAFHCERGGITEMVEDLRGAEVSPVGGPDPDDNNRRGRYSYFRVTAAPYELVVDWYHKDRQQVRQPDARGVRRIWPGGYCTMSTFRSTLDAVADVRFDALVPSTRNGKRVGFGFDARRGRNAAAGVPLSDAVVAVSPLLEALALLGPATHQMAQRDDALAYAIWHDPLPGPVGRAVAAGATGLGIRTTAYQFQPVQVNKYIQLFRFATVADGTQMTEETGDE